MEGGKASLEKERYDSSVLREDLDSFCVNEHTVEKGHCIKGFCMGGGGGGGSGLRYKTLKFFYFYQLHQYEEKIA